MSAPDEDEMDEAELVSRDVDQNPAAHNATEGDEEQVLRETYGEPDQYGVYRGEEA